MKKKFKLILIILWMLLIFLFSSQTGVSSTALSDSVSKPLITKVSNVNKVHHLVRKTAHFVSYFVLGFLVILYLSEYNLSKKQVLIAIIFCCLYAVSDETHQLFVDGRSSSSIDVLIDTVGSTLSILISCFYLTKKI